MPVTRTLSELGPEPVSPVMPALAATRVRISDCGRQVQLEQCLGASEVAGLADSELDQPRQPTLNDHTASTVFGKGLTLL